MEFQFTLLLHLIGLCLIAATVLGSWILNGQYEKADDWNTRAVTLRMIRPLGLLSPLAVLIMLVSGLGNIHALHYGIFSERWLTMKILLFVILAGVGGFSGVVAAKRSKLVAQIAGGTAPQGGDSIARSLASRQRFLIYVQILLLVLILFLSVFKP